MITIDLETFRQGGESANVTGVIFLELQDEAFPEKGWSDFPVIILGWWTEAWLQFVAPERHEAVWRFMDGPHCVTLIKEGDARSTGAFEFREVRGYLLGAAERVVAHCQRHSMLSRDLEILCGNVQRLRANQGTQGAEANLFTFLKLRPSAHHKG